MKEPKLLKISPNITTEINEISFQYVDKGAKILGFQKDFKAVDIRTNEAHWRPDFDMIDYYLIIF